jgi:hypothetical protein
MGGWSYSNKFHQIQLFNFDLMVKKDVSLKQLEGFMGHSIEETSVPFDIDRPLTPEEIEDVFKYCEHDVTESMWVFRAKSIKAVFDSQVDLIKEFNLPAKHFSKTRAQLSAIILGAIKSYRSDEFDISFPTTMRIEKYTEVVEWYKNKENMRYKDDKGNAWQLKTEIAGAPHVFGWGGIHGAIPNYIGEGVFLNMDISSMYPALIIEYNYMSRSVLDVEKYRRIRDMRLELKKVKDSRQESYKIVLNGTFGAKKDKFNNLYDPLMSNNICVTGQLLLLDLIERLEPHCQIIQSNTDGILIKLESKDKIPFIKNVVCKEWEQRTRLDLEFDEYYKVVQKDVNNYLVVPEGELYDEEGKPRWKSKGAYVKELSEIDNDLPIVNKAIVDYFVKNIPVETTVNESNKLIDFQKIVKVSRKYQHTLHGENVVKERVLRVFASSREEDGGITKVHVNGGHAKVGNTSLKCFIDNSHIVDKTVPEYLDRQWYIDLAKKRIGDFIKQPKRKKVVTNV